MAAIMAVPRPFGRPRCKPDVEPSKEATPKPTLPETVQEAHHVPEVEVPSTESPAGMPAVVSVKKSRSRGCAVVLLRDLAMIERCVLQRVAVIDGVCVEMTRHSKKSKNHEDDECEEDAEQQIGIFVAWGARVEKKIPVSEEGIEEYFNSLSGKACPAGLVATPPFQEGHVSFPLVSEAFAPLSWDIRSTPANHEEILSSTYCQRNLIEAQMAAKERLDALWDRPPPPMARSLMTRVARAQLFPSSGKGDNDKHENRAGDKLADLADISDLFDGIPAGSAFLDLCGGPGAWSQYLLAKKDLALRGFGFTLMADAGSADDWKAEAKDEWYADLEAHPNWTALWGADGTGDLLKQGNLDHCVQQLAREHVLLCVADGGFSDDAIPQNQLELYFYRLFLAELLTAVSCLSQGGKFICKLYTAFSASTASLLFLTTRLFDTVEIVKPMTSKATGPERYLVATGFHDDAESSVIQSALARSHALGGGASPLVTPLLTPVVPKESLIKDQKFVESMEAMVSSLCTRQTQALNAVVDRADFLESMAMESAICIDPWERMEETRQKEEQKDRAREERRAQRRMILDAPTPQLRGGKGKGKGKRSQRH